MLSIVQRVAHGTFAKSCPPKRCLTGSRNLFRSPSAYLRRHYVASTPPRTHKASSVNLCDAISDMERTLESIHKFVDVDKVSQAIQQTEAILEDPQLWITNPAGAAKVQSHLADMQHKLSTQRRLRSSFDRLQELSGLAEKAGDADLQSAVLLDLQGLRRGAEEYLVSLWLSDPLDQNSAYIDIRASSKDPDACDWASTLARMYTKWASSRNYTVRTVDVTPGDIAGVKATTILVEGRYAYGYVQYESGTHSLIRISPFDKTGVCHTSSADVRVLPCLEDDGISAAVDLKPADLQITTMRSHSNDEPHVGQPENAVRVVHTPTGITVSCQQEPSVHQNRTLTLSLLRAKLHDTEIQNQAQSAAAADHAQPAESWGPHIRSYTLQPDQLVKDFRTEYTVASAAAVQAVLDGDLGGFMEASLRKFKKA
ncbi:release factor [Trametes versicolor FP-101664 SS1]|uniref:release factor n=1 Tax=Trametes versicolor (strain FP-101664) TaxID=717944 RepID=UPI00046238AB|nr:release factor [Trametes versicolor FP-101664 SS1]EIW61674.1 release factor [Trametes versicolor FP-101664 SS1]